MKWKIKIFSLLLLSASFCFGQEQNYEIIQQGAMEYEFNKASDIIYILTEDEFISVYDTENKITAKIELKNYNRIANRDHTLYLSETDTLFVFGAQYIYKLFEDSFIEYIPFLLESKIDMGLLDENTAYSEQCVELNDFLINVVEAYKINSCSIFVNSDGETLATRDINESLLRSKYSIYSVAHISKAMDVVFARGEHYRKKDRKGRNTGGETKQIIFYQNVEIQDQIYSCEKQKEYTQAKCKYRMKIITPDKTYLLNDKIQRHRYVGIGFGKHQWTCDLFYRAPTSSYISDKKGDIYILLNSKENEFLDLIKLL